jgi:TonB-dependent receptor-like protein
MRYSRLGLAIPLLCGLLVVARVPAETRASYRGRPLTEVLAELRESGLHLILSSAVVSPELVVLEEPSAEEPRAILDQVLAPLCLEARPGPGDSILIVRRPVRPPTYSTEVTVTPDPRSSTRTPIDSRVTLTSSEIQRTPGGSTDPMRSIEQLPGIGGEGGEGIGGSPNIRGSLAGDSSLVLDGMELYEPYHLPAIQSVSAIDGRSVDRIELLNGGLTAEYGDRHGGFVEVTTGSSFSEPHGEVEVGTLNSRASYGAPYANGAGSWLVTMREWYPEGPFDTHVFGQDREVRPRFRDAYAKLDWSVSPRQLVSVHALLVSDELGFDDNPSDARESIDVENRSGYFWLSSIRAWSDKITTKTLLSGGQIERRRAGAGDAEQGLVLVDDDRTLGFVGFNQDIVWNVSGRQMVKAGLYGRRLQADYRYSATLGGAPTSEVALDPAGVSLGVYVAHRTQITPKVAAEVGRRWDHQDYTDDSQTSPRFNLLWQTGRGGELRFGLGRFHQSQRINELAVADGETEFLPAEHSDQVELGYGQRLGRGLAFRVDAYSHRLSDLRPRYENLFGSRELFPEISEDRVRIAPDSSRLRGVELALERSAGSRLSWRVGYAYSSAEDEIDGGWVPRGWDQAHAASATVGYDWGGRWFASLASIVRSGRPTPSVALAPGLYSARLPTYARLDLGVRRTLQLSRGSRLSVNLDVLNLTDRRNVCCVDGVGVATPGDGAPQVETRYDYWQGITPVFGVRWEF